MNWRICLGVFAVIGLLLLSSLAWANISVRPLVTIIEATDSEFTDILVQNDGNQRAYVEVTAARIANPGQDSEARVESPNPAEVGILATPQRMVLEPGTSRIVRLALLDRQADREQVFRVLIENVSGGLTGEDRQVNVGMLISFDTLVIARPANPEAILEQERSDSRFVIRNTGNAAALLFDGKACSGAACRPLELVRLYSGASAQYRVEPDEIVSFEVEWPDNTRGQISSAP